MAREDLEAGESFVPAIGAGRSPVQRDLEPPAPQVLAPDEIGLVLKGGPFEAGLGSCPQWPHGLGGPHAQALQQVVHRRHIL